MNSEQTIRASFARQKMMETIGASILRVGEGEIELLLPFRQAFTQQHGYLHAGVITAILDTACGYAALTRMPENAEVVSVEFKVNLLSPGVGEEFIARARTLRSGRTLSVCAADLFALTPGGEILVATMLGTMMVR